MLRVLSALFAISLLTACGVPMPEADVAATQTAGLSSEVNGVDTMRTPAEPNAEASSEPSDTPRAGSPTTTPTRVPTPVGTPRGSTGLAGDRSPGMTYDDDCAQGDGEASPPAARIDPPSGGYLSEFPGAYQPISFEHDKELQRLLDAAVGDRAGSYAFYVKDLTTGRGAMLNEGEVFNAASIFKLFVMYEMFHQEDLGLFDWTDELVITPYYDAFALSPRTTAVCQAISIGAAMDAMLSVSDNAAAVLLQDFAGSNNINSAIESLGLTDSGLFEDGLPVTAGDLALLMEAIATGNAISPEASADMLKLLDHDVFENGLVSGLPAGTVVSRKTGNWSDATNVAGVVYAPSGPYVFVALTSNGYETHIIQALSSAAYAHFTGTSAQGGR